MAEIKILHCLHSQSWGGLEIYTVELIEQLSLRGYSQCVFCAESSRVHEALKKIPLLNILTFTQRKLSKFSAARRIYKIALDHGITHLHSHSRLDMWACALAKSFLPDVKHFYNLYMNATPKKDFIHRWLFSKVDALCSSSENILQDVRKNFPIESQKLKLIRYGRKIENFHSRPEIRDEIRKKLQASPENLVVGSLCRIDPGKGVQELVESLNYLSDEELSQIQLWIIGDPTTIGKNPDASPVYQISSKELETWVHLQMQNPRLKRHIHRIGFQKDYVAYLEAMDVFVLASYNETYSLSVIDAMLMGKPVVGTNAGGTPEQIEAPRRGLLAEPQNAQSLANALKCYLKEPELIKKQGPQAQSWALENHSWVRILEAYERLYTES